MAGSLFDQLKKAGLVDDKKAKKAKQEKHQQLKKNKSNKSKKGEAAPNEAAKLVAEAAQRKAEHDRQLNLERQQQQAKKAVESELRQVIESNRLSGYNGEVVYNFVDDNKVKTLHVNKVTHQRLTANSIRIARFDDGYALIPESVVEKVEQRDKNVMIPIATEDDSISKEDQDYYAQFEVPDDLIW